VIEVRSTVRAGRLTRQERLEDGGRIQSWVLAGEKGAAEVRGDRAENLYYLIHEPCAAGPDVTHSTLVLLDAGVWPEPGCTVLEGDCRPWLFGIPGVRLVARVGDLWEDLESLYRVHLADSR
jgi:hypothetical protein